MSEPIASFDAVDAVFAKDDAVAKNLRRKFASQVKEMSELRVGKSVAALFIDWTVIFGAIVLCEQWLNPLSYLLAAMVIAGRQHGLLVLIHDAAHFRVSKTSWVNDFLSDYLAAIPTFFDTKMYRLHHSKHHRFLNGENDPDWVRKRERPAWQFPIAKSFVAKTYPKFVLVNGAVEWMNLSLVFSSVLPLKTVLKSPQRRQFLKRAAYFAVVAGCVTFAGVWREFLMYWIAPLFFVFPTFQRMRSVAEHFGLKREHELNSSRNILAPWYETIFFAPHFVNYHLVHHMFPAVPFYNLKRLNELLMTDEDYRRLAHQNHSYILPSAYPLTSDLFDNADVSKAPERQNKAA